MSLTGDAPSWQKVKVLLAQVLEHSPEERLAMAEQLSAGDPAMRDELCSLLAAAGDDHTLRGVSADLVLQALQARLSAPITEPGRRVGPWRIVSLIARGGMGEVYRAERADGQFEQQVALKLLRSGFDQDWLISRFAAERRILASLDHPNLARVLDGGTTGDGMPYFVMELVDGQPIDRYAQGLPVQARLALFRTLCQVVGYAHSKGVVHRDLKTDNVLVTGDGVVKLVDFGIAKQIAADAQATATAQRMMTLAYSSPEQVRGGEVTPASDVYSLGVVLYRLLTQTSPYGSATTNSGYELTRAICDTEPPPPSRASTTAPALTRAQRRRLRGDLDAVVMMALRKDPSRRYANAADLGDDIFRHMENLPVRARRGAWSYRANRFVLRHRVVFGAAMLANLALVAGLGAAVIQSVEASKQRERAEGHLATVREFANVLIFDVHKAISLLPGATAARQLIVDKALAYLEKVSAESRDNPVLQLELASAYRKLADVHSGPGMSSAGDRSGATRSYQRARALLEPLAQPEHAGSARYLDALHELKMVQQSLGTIYVITGRPEEAKASLQAAVDVSRRAIAQSPTSLRAASDLATSYLSLAELLRSQGKTDAAAEAIDRAKETLAPALRREPDNWEAWNVNAMVHFTRGMFYRAAEESAGKAPLAGQQFDLARKSFEKVLELLPGSAITTLALAKLNLVHGDLLQRTGEHDRAIDTLGRAVKALESLSTADPSDHESRVSLATAKQVLGHSLNAKGDYTAGMAETLSAIDTMEQLAKTHPPSNYEVFNLANAYHDLGLDMRAQADRQSDSKRQRAMACEKFERGKALMQGLNKSSAYFAELLGKLEQALKTCR
jgi:eukaryotic-like serine/threonine-protein kinase